MNHHRMERKQYPHETFAFPETPGRCPGTGSISDAAKRHINILVYLFTFSLPEKHFKMAYFSMVGLGSAYSEQIGFAIN